MRGLINIRCRCRLGVVQHQPAWGVCGLYVDTSSMGYGWGCGTERKTQGERASVERCGSGLRHHLVESTEAYPSGSPREIGAFGLKVSQGGTVTWTKDKSFFFFLSLFFLIVFFFFSTFALSG